MLALGPPKPCGARTAVVSAKQRLPHPERNRTFANPFQRRSIPRRRMARGAMAAAFPDRDGQAEKPVVRGSKPVSFRIHSVRLSRMHLVSGPSRWSDPATRLRLSGFETAFQA
jgi:hypothetical protein